MAMSAMIVMPSQNALKFPATRPDRMLSDGPPSRDDVTTSRVCALSVDVNTFTNSGMIAPASVPHVNTTDTIDVSHTSTVSGASKFILSAFAYRAFAIAALIRYDAPLAMTIMMR